MNWKLSFVMTVITLSGLSMAVSGCKWDSEEALFNTVTCDTTSISYSKTIKPMLANSCVGCHNSGFESGGVSLETHKDVRVYAKNGLLMGTVRHEPGFSAMPKGGQKFSDCQIQQLQAWVNKGAPND